MNTDLQKAGGISALVSSASYVFALVLFMTLMSPLAEPRIGFNEYMAFAKANASMVYIWTFSMYIIHGLSIVVLVAALYQRLKEKTPGLALVSSFAGVIWAGFVLLSGFISIFCNETLIALYAKNPDQAESFKQIYTSITLGVDLSDRMIGSLWLGLASLASLKSGVFPKWVGIFGIIFTLLSIITSLVMPVADTSASLFFACGAMVWWVAAGICMIRRHG